MFLVMASSMYIHSADEKLNIEKRCGESDSLRLFHTVIDKKYISIVEYENMTDWHDDFFSIVDYGIIKV